MMIEDKTIVKFLYLFIESALQWTQILNLVQAMGHHTCVTATFEFLLATDTALT